MDCGVARGVNQSGMLKAYSDGSFAVAKFPSDSVCAGLFVNSLCIAAALLNGSWIGNCFTAARLVARAVVA